MNITAELLPGKRHFIRETGRRTHIPHQTHCQYRRMARSPPSEDYTETISQPHHTDQAVLDTHQLLYISLVDRS